MCEKCHWREVGLRGAIPPPRNGAINERERHVESLTARLQVGARFNSRSRRPSLCRRPRHRRCRLASRRTTLEAAPLQWGGFKGIEPAYAGAGYSSSVVSRGSMPAMAGSVSANW